MAGLLEAVGLTLVHFVWQGAFVAALLYAVLAALRQRGPEARYLACCAALGAFVLLPVATFARLASGDPAPVFDRALVTSLPSTGPLAALTPLLPWIATFWLGGVSALQLRTVYLWLCTRRLRRAGIAALPHGWDAIVDDLHRRLGLRHAVRVVRSSVARVPMVVGWLQPVVLIPLEAFTGLEREQLRAIVAHELAHVRRHDAWVNLLQIGIETTLFFHPAVWWVSRRLRIEREFCCDDLAVRVCGDPLVYARALGRLDALRDPSPALAATGGTLVQRIERLIQARRPTRPAATGLLLAGLVLATGLIATGFAIAGDEPEPPAPPPPPVAAPAPVATAGPPIAPSTAPRPPAPPARRATVPTASSAPLAPPARLAPTHPAPPPRPATVPSVAATRPSRLAPAPSAPLPRLATVPSATSAPPSRLPAAATVPLATTPPSRPAPAPELSTAITEPRFPAPQAPESRVAEPAVPAPEAEPVEVPEPEPTDQIQRQLDDIRRLRLELEQRERRLLRLLERYEELEREPAGADGDPVVRIKRKPVVRVKNEKPKRRKVVKVKPVKLKVTAPPREH